MAKNLIFTFVYSLLFSGCKSLYDQTNYIKSPVKGAIGGAEWAYGYAYTDPEAKLPDGAQYMIVLMTSKATNACPTLDDKVKDQREVAITIDGKPGEMKIGGRIGQYETADDAFTYRKQVRQATVAFFDPKKPSSKQYQFATVGRLKITKLNDQEIEGAIVAKADPSHFVNGRFKAKICKWGQLN